MLETHRAVFVNGGKELAPYKSRILGLFSLCFGSNLDSSLWDWAYLDNPCGDAFVSLVFSGDELVGHYAAIPQRYRGDEQEAEFILSMTTMVHPDHRAAGLFRDMAETTYKEAAQKGALGVLGFPNKNSLPGFKKRLNWRVDETLQLHRHPLDRAALSSGGPPRVRAIDSEEFSSLFRAPSALFGPDLGNRDFLRWRLSKPGQRYQAVRLDDAVFLLKTFRDGLDVVYADALNEEIFRELAKFAVAAGLGALSVLGPKPLAEPVESTAYYFGSRAFQGSDRSFAVNPIMSDVF